MNRLFYLKLATFALLSLPFLATADFNVSGDLNVKAPNSAKQESNLAIGYTAKEYDHTFSIGKAEYKVTGRPEKYSFAIVLQKNNYVWVQEFSKGLIESFDWEVGEYKIKLYKKILSKPVMGDYILSINEKDYFFSKNIAQLTFIFNDEGIEEIEVDGMVASLGLNKAKTECPEVEEGSEPSEDGC